VLPLLTNVATPLSLRQVRLRGALAAGLRDFWVTDSHYIVLEVIE
jgi:hypothetical protein